MRWWVLLLLVAVSACGRKARGNEETPPAPSVVTLGIEVNACSDVDACAKDCDKGSADTCRRLAASYAFGKGVGQDEARATALYERACDLHDPSACVFAGQMHEFAHGVQKDDASAARFYERACDANWAAGCYNLGIMYERGTGVPADRAKAGDLYQMACTAGAKSACAKAAAMHAPKDAPFLEGGVP